MDILSKRYAGFVLFHFYTVCVFPKEEREVIISALKDLKAKQIGLGVYVEGELYPGSLYEARDAIGKDHIALEDFFRELEPWIIPYDESILMENSRY